MSELSIRGALPNLPSLTSDKASSVGRGELSIGGAAGGGGGGSTSGASFIDTLKGAMSNVNESMMSADKAAQKFASGKAENLHDVMIAMEKADLSLRTLTAVRGKLVEAYHEIMKMPV